MKYLSSLICLFLLMANGVASAGVVLTEQQQQTLIDNANVPEIAAIRKYLDACLSGQVLEDYQFKGGFLYPCYPEGNVNTPKGSTILEHPIDHIDGRFIPYSRYDNDFGGENYVILFDEPPYLMFHVWIYKTADGMLDVRSFIANDGDIGRGGVVEAALMFKEYLSDPRFTR
jgi:hypothetical protein